MKKAELKKPLSLRALKGLGKEIWKGVDTNILIYYIEEHPVYFKKVAPFIDRIADSKAART